MNLATHPSTSTQPPIPLRFYLATHPSTERSIPLLGQWPPIPLLATYPSAKPPISLLSHQSLYLVTHLSTQPHIPLLKATHPSAQPPIPQPSLVTHPLSQPFIPILVLIATHPSAQPPFRPSLCLFTHPSTQPPIFLLGHPSLYLATNPYIYSYLQPPIPLLSHPSLYLATHPYAQQPILNFNLFSVIMKRLSEAFRFFESFRLFLYFLVGRVDDSVVTVSQSFSPSRSAGWISQLYIYYRINNKEIIPLARSILAHHTELSLCHVYML